ncbi:TetR/AcrR family transcriptional regulator [Georgenia wangjunii]|uniref:TetR/AcrR family transcriptional regulator n=1 Tax=Georgenia wangjunii TaxID=3117730 RepID=UPI002F2660E3
MRPRQSPKAGPGRAVSTGPSAAVRGAEVRRRLLAAAVVCVPELGWTGVSTRVLAARAGVAPGLVHYHFPSVQVLLRTAAVDALAEALAEAEQVLASAGGADGVAALLEQLERHAGADARSLLFVEMYLASARDEALHGDLRRLLLAFRRALEGHLHRGGVADPGGTAAVLAAAVDGVLLHRVIDPSLTASMAVPVLSRLLGTREHR